ncbi:hypothetical protein [Saccharothrix sp. NRRL B-16314]|uniref:hypothetical protein n=1 Tax=Saccharothrix sp. NRRL B-16314 TaxID=1463825 RepID=UPI0012DC74B1|nr:hypothetical protein [Saccharothrix sp. NRRL B-16314]
MNKVQEDVFGNDPAEQAPPHLNAPAPGASFAQQANAQPPPPLRPPMPPAGRPMPPASRPRRSRPCRPAPPPDHDPDDDFGGSILR